MNLRAATLLILLGLPAISQAVVVNFSGVLDNFNVGPFSGGDSFSGSFTLDETVVPTGTSVQTFTGIVDDLQLTIDGHLYTGNDGKVQQFTSSNGLTDFISLEIGNNGNVTDHDGLFDFRGMSLDLRGSNLFGDPSQIAEGLTSSDFNYKRVTFKFGSSSLFWAIDNVSAITFSGNALSVPAPWTSIVLVIALFAMRGFSAPNQLRKLAPAVS